MSTIYCKCLLTREKSRTTHKHKGKNHSAEKLINAIYALIYRIKLIV